MEEDMNKSSFVLFNDRTIFIVQPFAANFLTRLLTPSISSPTNIFQITSIPNISLSHSLQAINLKSNFKLDKRSFIS